MDQNVTKAGLIVIAVIGLAALLALNTQAMQWMQQQFATLFPI